MVVAVSLTVAAGAFGQPAGVGDDTVAVEPFVNLTGQAEDAWIGAGIADSLTAGLAPRFAVVDANGSPETRLLLTGAYQRLADRIRITATLTERATGDVVRSAKVDGALDDLFAL